MTNYLGPRGPWGHNGGVLVEENVEAPAITADDVDEASLRIEASVSRTPLLYSDRLSDLCQATVLLKREDLQTVRSYKIRGAFNFMLQLTEEERSRGVVAASAGNHAQGLARACNDLAIYGRIFVPRTTPRQKLDRIRYFGGSWVDLQVAGSTYDDASALARKYAESSGALVVSAFDDPRTIAGQGTVAAEIQDQLDEDPDLIVVPVGGGGLLAGMATHSTARMPGATTIGVEPAGAACMMAALAVGHPVTLDTIDGFADGTAVKRAGNVTFDLVSRLGIEVRSVPEGRAATEMLELYQIEGLIAEPSGALASASIGPVGSGAPVEVEPGSTVVCVVSGGNNDISRYTDVLERSLVHEGLRHYFIVDFPQEPGALRKFLDDVLGPHDDISLFDYVKRNDRETGPAFVGLTLGYKDDLPGLLERMEASPLDIERVTQDSPLFKMLS